MEVSSPGGTIHHWTVLSAYIIYFVSLGFSLFNHNSVFFSVNGEPMQEVSGSSTATVKEEVSRLCLCDLVSNFP